MEATQKRCADLTSELHAIWTNEIAASYGQMPRLGVELPDLGHLRLPAAGADGATLADPRGLEMDAGWHFAQVSGARRTSHMGGVRQGLKIAATARGR